MTSNTNPSIQQLTLWENPDLSTLTKAGVSIPSSYVLEGLRSMHLYAFNLVNEVLEEGLTFKEALVLLAMNLNDGLESTRSKAYRAISFIQENNILVKLKANLLASTFDFEIFDELMSLHMYRPDLAKTLTKERLYIYGLVQDELLRYGNRPNLTKVFDFIAKEHDIDAAKVRTSFRIMEDYLYGLGASDHYKHKFPKPANMSNAYDSLLNRSKTSSRSYFFKRILNELKRGNSVHVTLADGSQHTLRPPVRQTSKVYALLGYSIDGKMTDPYTYEVLGESVSVEQEDGNTSSTSTASSVSTSTSSSTEVAPEPQVSFDPELVDTLKALNLGNLESDSVESVLRNCVTRLEEYDTYQREIETLVTKQAHSLHKHEESTAELVKKAAAYDVLHEFLHTYVKSNPSFHVVLTDLLS